MSTGSTIRCLGDGLSIEPRRRQEDFAAIATFAHCICRSLARRDMGS
jgi:hypothetical protein